LCWGTSGGMNENMEYLDYEGSRLAQTSNSWKNSRTRMHSVYRWEATTKGLDFDDESIIATQKSIKRKLRSSNPRILYERHPYESNQKSGYSDSINNAVLPLSIQSLH
jgi:hypothetical protein